MSELFLTNHYIRLAKLMREAAKYFGSQLDFNPETEGDDDSGEEGNIPPGFAPIPDLVKECAEMEEKVSTLHTSLTRKLEPEPDTVTTKKSKTQDQPEAGPSQDN